MDKKADIPITILVIGVVLICSIAIVSFFMSTIKARNSFVGVNLMEQMNAQIERTYFNEKEMGMDSAGRTINDAFNYAKNELKKCNCEPNCDSYATFVSQSASARGIDPLLLLAIMMQESECKTNAASPSSFGLMQINLIHCGNYNLPSDKEECKNALKNNPQLNIEIGAQILKGNYDSLKAGKEFDCMGKKVFYTEWEAALRAYVGWGCDAFHLNYVEEVIARYEALKKSGGNYIERRETRGFLFWAKEVFLFSVEYKNQGS
ncbi:hypothetical protein A3K82_01125 [Candidatus Pacearchaeota archaeon RBG_19FT_COMBO_34_9]|nr:MAG: hypothetical protein A3K82_01125 [Candidatus Pacearchaeota archaeon RBG_19FT_COMBO_34_9]OGJ16509.1 MAG: hypothetical protein A3K74_00145 [Candidatus Pacearchaeota archaeon RBG_13_33_26]